MMLSVNTLHVFFGGTIKPLSTINWAKKYFAKSYTFSQAGAKGTRVQMLRAGQQVRPRHVNGITK